ncbi:MAG TPA: PAS domain S-box protein, partial [Bacteroidota bacterium]|nr:PAS domain S-box protein [Bacteroidota bacterium]
RTGLMSARTVTINGEPCVLSVTRDISDRKSAEKALYASNATLKALVDTLPVAIVVLDGNDRVQVWNPAAERIFGWASSEIIGKAYPLVPPGLKDGCVECAVGFPHGGRVVERETVRQRKDGTLIDVTLSVALLSDVESPAPHRVAMMTDITDRKSSELQLRQLSRAVEQSASTIVITDLMGNIEYVNPKFQQSTGYTPEEAIGKNPRMLKSGETPSAEYAQLWKTIKAGGEWRGEFHNKKKNGELYWESASISPIRNADGVVTHFLAVKEDITERKQMELQIRQMHNMQSIGTLAGGVAHDFNNILGIILGHISLLEKRAHDPVGFEHSIEAITKAIQRGAGLVRQILTFARKTETHPEPVNVNESIQDLARMILETFPKTIEIRLDLSDGIPLITIDHTQFHQALLNLCVNARDAMMTPRDDHPQGGKLTVRTDLASGAALARYDGASAALPYVHISVSDDGPGMSEEVRQRIFEPFFTTKKIGEGTGLGLALVYGVVKSHNGIVVVETMLGEGSTFHLYFPMTEGASPSPVETARTELHVPGGKEGLLVVEDEAALLGLLEAAFSDRGYHIHSAQDGSEAVEVYRKEKDDIALVVTDLGLPKSDGASVVRQLLSINPLLRIIVASGFFEPEVKSQLTSIGVRGFLSKPYRMEEVLLLVREVLDEP